jgi:malic enzyme
VLTFNDDMQGTGAMNLEALSGVKAGARGTRAEHDDPLLRQGQTR